MQIIALCMRTWREVKRFRKSEISLDTGLHRFWWREDESTNNHTMIFCNQAQNDGRFHELQRW